MLLTFISAVMEIRMHPDDGGDTMTGIYEAIYNAWHAVADASQAIKEFDIGLIGLGEIADDRLLARIEQSHYLLVNKRALKRFYQHWCGKFFTGTVDQVNVDCTTLCILLINPNIGSAWSRRRQALVTRLAQATSASLIEWELYTNKLILLKHVKCEQAFVHRRWTLKQMAAVDCCYSSELLRDELTFVLDTLVKRGPKSNYYCWSYLNWLLAYALARHSSSPSTVLATFDVWLKRTDMLFTNPSDYCVFHARLNAFKLLHESGIRAVGGDELIVVDEISLCDQLLVLHAHSSCTWHYRRYFLLFTRKLVKLDASFRRLNTALIDFCKKSYLSRRGDWQLNFDGWLEQLEQQHASSSVSCPIGEREKRVADLIALLHEQGEYCEQVRSLAKQQQRFADKFFI